MGPESSTTSTPTPAGASAPPAPSEASGNNDLGHVIQLVTGKCQAHDAEYIAVCGEPGEDLRLLCGGCAYDDETKPPAGTKVHLLAKLDHDTVRRWVAQSVNIVTERTNAVEPLAQARQRAVAEKAQALAAFQERIVAAGEQGDMNRKAATEAEEAMLRRLYETRAALEVARGKELPAVKQLELAIKALAVSEPGEMGSAVVDAQNNHRRQVLEAIDEFFPEARQEQADEVDTHMHQQLASEVAKLNAVHASAMAQLLINSMPNLREGVTPLHVAVQHLDCEDPVAVIRELLEQGVDLHAKNKEGRTALDIAVRWNTSKHAVAIVEYLLTRKADLNAKNQHGGTALHVAALYNTSEQVLGIAETLLRHGADLHAANSYGETPLHLAMRNASLHAEALVSFLLDQGADLRAMNNDGLTPLHVGAGWNTTKWGVAIIDKLLERGANLNAKNARGGTALHVAAACNISEHAPAIVGLLIDRGIEVNALNSYGETALDLVEQSASQYAAEVTRLLKDCGAISGASKKKRGVLGLW